MSARELARAALLAAGLCACGATPRQSPLPSPAPAPAWVHDAFGGAQLTFERPPNWTREEIGTGVLWTSQAGAGLVIGFAGTPGDDPVASLRRAVSLTDGVVTTPLSPVGVWLDLFRAEIDGRLDGHPAHAIWHVLQRENALTCLAVVYAANAPPDEIRLLRRVADSVVAAHVTPATRAIVRSYERN